MLARVWSMGGQASEKWSGGPVRSAIRLKNAENGPSGWASCVQGRPLQAVPGSARPRVEKGVPGPRAPPAAGPVSLYPVA